GVEGCAHRDRRADPRRRLVPTCSPGIRKSRKALARQAHRLTAREIETESTPLRYPAATIRRPSFPYSWGMATSSQWLPLRFATSLANADGREDSLQSRSMQQREADDMRRRSEDLARRTAGRGHG